MAKELLFRLTRKDFIIEAKRGSGKGGQNRNVTNSACRIRHPASGAEAQSQDQRDYKTNERTAFLRLLETDKFKTWHKMECSRRMGILKDVDKTVEQMMKPENIAIETRVEGKWKRKPDEDWGKKVACPGCKKEVLEADLEENGCCAVCNGAEDVIW